MKIVLALALGVGVLAGCGGGTTPKATTSAPPSAAPTLDTYAVVSCRHFHDANQALDAFLPGASQLDQSNAIQDIPGMADVVTDYQDGIVAANRSTVPNVRSRANALPYVGSETVGTFIAYARQWTQLCTEQGWVPGL